MKQEAYLSRLQHDTNYYDQNGNPVICVKGAAKFLGVSDENWYKTPLNIKATLSTRKFVGSRRIKFAFSYGEEGIVYFLGKCERNLYIRAREAVERSAPRFFRNGRPFVRYVKIEPITA